MRLLGTRRSAIVAIGLALAGLGAGQAIAARGGLSVTPGILEHVARPGEVGAMKVSNTTNEPMRVGFAVRPWAQARNGAVTPDRGGTLGKVRPNLSSFNLRAGASRTVHLSLARVPARGALYGAIEVTGTPRHRGGRGVRVAYRLVSSLRLNPSSGAQTFRVGTGRLFAHGTARRGALYLAVRNAGNTILPIGGRVRISGKRHTLRNDIAPMAVLPGATVNLLLTRLRGTLPSGRYSVAAHLTQGGRSLGVVARHGFLLN